MKIINPLHLIQFVVVYLYTWYALRSAARAEGFNVGWSSPHDDFQVYYNAQVNVLGVITPAQDTTWQPSAVKWISSSRKSLTLLRIIFPNQKSQSGRLASTKSEDAGVDGAIPLSTGGIDPSPFGRLD